MICAVIENEILHPVFYGWLSQIIQSSLLALHSTQLEVAIRIGRHHLIKYQNKATIIVSCFERMPQEEGPVESDNQKVKPWSLPRSVCNLR